MKSLVLSIPAYTLLAGVIVSLWPNLWPFLTIGLAFIFLSASIALGVLLIGWSVFRVRTVKEDSALEAISSVFAQQTTPPKSVITLDTQHSWKIAYLQIAFLAHSKGSFSFRTLAPYLESNAREYWDHMKGQLSKAGWVENKGGKIGMVFSGSYRRYSAGVRLGKIVLAPHPKLPPPRVIWVAQGSDTQITEITLSTLDTLEAKSVNS